MKSVGTTTRVVVETDPGLIIEYRMRGVLFGPRLRPDYQHAVAAVMMRCSQSVASVWLFEWFTAATKRPWTVGTATGRPIRLISTTMILDAERNLFRPMIRQRVWSSVVVIVFNTSPLSPWDQRLGFLNDTLWHSTDSRHLLFRKSKTWQLNKAFNNCGPDTGWHDCHFGLRW